MLFYTCADRKYFELRHVYEYCARRAYPGAGVRIDMTENPSVDRFLIDPGSDRVHITDIDILILPNEKKLETYYDEHMLNGASYTRGVIYGADKTWERELSRVTGGHFSVTREYYKRTSDSRKEVKTEFYREFDEVVLNRILASSGYVIPNDSYHFPDGHKWDTTYRELHLGDFRSEKYLKWQPDKKKMAELFKDRHFVTLVRALSKDWKDLFNKALEYTKT